MSDIGEQSLKGALFSSMEEAEEDDIDEQELMNLMREKRNNRVH
jgi:hypothetical protein